MVQLNDVVYAFSSRYVDEQKISQCALGLEIVLAQHQPQDNRAHGGLLTGMERCLYSISCVSPQWSETFSFMR